MRLGVGGLVLVGCVALGAARLPVWSSDLALWGHAVDVAPALPRANVNYAAALIRAGRYREGALWAARAADLTARDGTARDRRHVPRLVQQQLRWVSLFEPVCGRPALSPYC